MEWEGRRGERKKTAYLLLCCLLARILIALAWLAASSTHKAGCSRRRGEVWLPTDTAC